MSNDSIESKKRTVMIFPEFINMKYIDQLRERYDPLANKVRPHITLVFPFEASFSENEISEILRNRLHTIEPFEVIIKGLSIQDRWLILDVITGTETVLGATGYCYSIKMKGVDMSMSTGAGFGFISFIIVIIIFGYQIWTGNNILGNSYDKYPEFGCGTGIGIVLIGTIIGAIISGF